MIKKEVIIQEIIQLEKPEDAVARTKQLEATLKKELPIILQKLQKNGTSNDNGAPNKESTSTKTEAMSPDPDWYEPFTEMAIQIHALEKSVKELKEKDAPEPVKGELDGDEQIKAETEVKKDVPSDIPAENQSPNAGEYDPSWDAADRARVDALRKETSKGAISAIAAAPIESTIDRAKYSIEQLFTAGHPPHKHELPTKLGYVGYNNYVVENPENAFQVAVILTDTEGNEHRVPKEGYFPVY